MNFLRATIAELLGMFIDDGALALFAIIWIAVVAIAVKLLGLPPLLGGLGLLLGCIAILAESLARAARRAAK